MPAKKLLTAEPHWHEVYQRWQLNVQKDGKRKSFYSSVPGRAGKAEVRARAEEWLLSLNTTELRLSRAWELFMAEQKANTGTANCEKHDYIYRIYITQCIPDKHLKNITPYEWQKCINFAAQKGLSKRTCSNIKATISRFRTFCEMNKYDHDIPASRMLKIPKTARSGKRKVLQPDGLRTLFTIDTVPARNRKGGVMFVWYIYMWRFLVLTGMRRGEACGLLWSDIDGNVVHLRRSINRYGETTQGKNENAVRDLRLSAHARAMLDAQRKLLSGSGIISPLVFTSMDGSPINPDNLTTAWIRYRSKVGIDVSIHELRHTFVSAVKADMPEALLKAMVGHSADMDTYDTYGHEFDDDMQRTADIIDAVYARYIG